MGKRWLIGAAIGLGMAGRAFAGGTPLEAVKVASGLSDPVYVTHAPGDAGRVFIVEQTGQVRILDISVDPPVLQNILTPFLNIASRLVSGGEQGLLGFAFHPDFANNGYFYVNYTRTSPGAGDTVVARYHVPVGTPNDADEASELILLVVDQPQSNHNGGWIAFGPDGYLYIAMGDGGGADDSGTGHTAATGNGQDITTNLLGKMLRIDVNGDDFPVDPLKNYAVPPTNPFVGEAGDDEIWSYGLRNPWRNAFDSVTGDLYIADVGQNIWEEINFQPGASAGGENWGWRCREGAHNFNFQAFCAPLTFVDPIHEYSHGSGCSISGGEVYRGCRIPDLDGTYFFADYCTTTIWSFVYAGGPPVVTNRTAELEPAGADTISAISSFGRDAEGELYICDHSDGEVYKIAAVGGGVPCGGPPPAPTVGDDVCVSSGGAARGATPCSKNADCSTGEVCGLKNRYITFNPADGNYGIKVTCTSSPDLSAVGDVQWVGTAASYSDTPPAGALSIDAAELSCTFATHNFGHLTRLHVYGQLIMPDSAYTVEACIAEAGPCSNPLVIETATWGDVAPLMGGASQPDFIDIAAVVDKFQGDNGSVSRTRAQLTEGGVDPAVPVSFLDVSMDVDAFQSDPFPYESTSCGG